MDSEHLNHLNERINIGQQVSREMDNSSHSTKPRRTAKHVSAEDSGTLHNEVQQRGISKVIDYMRQMAPDKTRTACASALNSCIREPQKNWNSTSISLLHRTAKAFRDMRKGITWEEALHNSARGRGRPYGVKSKKPTITERPPRDTSSSTQNTTNVPQKFSQALDFDQIVAAVVEKLQGQHAATSQGHSSQQIPTPAFSTTPRLKYSAHDWCEIMRQSLRANSAGLSMKRIEGACNTFGFPALEVHTALDTLLKCGEIVTDRNNVQHQLLFKLK